VRRENLHKRPNKRTIPTLLRYLCGRDYGSIQTNTTNLHFFQPFTADKSLGSLFHTKSQINFSVAIQTTQQVVSKRLESERGDSQLWHLK